MDVFVIGADGEMCVMDVPAGCSDLAGFESWRTSVWGSESVRALGARFFPTLARGDLSQCPGEWCGGAAPRPSARAGLVRSKDSRSASPVPRTSSPSWTPGKHVPAGPSTSACPPLLAPPAAATLLLSPDVLGEGTELMSGKVGRQLPGHGLDATARGTRRLAVRAGGLAESCAHPIVSSTGIEGGEKLGE